jgi:hypothetical protein
MSGVQALQTMSWHAIAIIKASTLLEDRMGLLSDRYVIFRLDSIHIKDELVLE